MKLFLGLLLATLLRGSTSSVDETRLRRHLFHHPDNDILTTPIHNSSDYVALSIGIQIQKLIEMDDVQQVMKLQYFMAYGWQDNRLKWNVSEFGGIEVIQIRSSFIWTPQLLLENNAKQAHVNEITPESDYVFVYPDGNCLWEPRYELSVTQCSIDVTWFPFDKQICHLKFMSWILMVNNILLTPDLANVGFYDESSDWTSEGINATTSYAGYYPKLDFKLHLRRKPRYYVLNIILPCCLLSFITVATFLLQPNCYDRLGLTVTIVLAITVYQIIVNDQLPTTSNTPVISMYLFFIVVTSVCTVFFTIIVQRINLHAETIPLVAMPAWMKILFCKWLAACLCMKPKSSPSREPRHISMSRWRAATSDRLSKEDENKKISSMETTENDPLKKLMTEIRDLLKIRIQNEEQQRNADEQEEKIKNDWMLAAAVLDRICAIAFVIIFVVGTAVFIELITTHRE